MSTHEPLCVNPWQALYLNDNQVGDDGAKALASAVANGALKNCTQLRLSDNKIGNDGMCSLADALANGALPQLRSLFLPRNQIGDEGMAALADAIKPVSAGGSGALAQAGYVVLSDNNIGDDGLRALSSALAEGALPACRACFVDGNPASDEAQQAVKDALASRSW